MRRPKVLAMSIGIAVSLLFFGSLALAAAFPAVTEYVRFLPCKIQGPDGSTKSTECVFSKIESVLKNERIGPALNSFLYAYDAFGGKLDVDCHSAIHRVGDMAYFELFQFDGDLSDYDFTSRSIACGAGFFHGFFEHMIQDRPQPDFIVEVCSYFDRGPEYMRHVGVTCFHSAGHGLIRAAAEVAPRTAWGVASEFVSGPIQECDRMQTDSGNIENCKTGVISIFIQFHIHRDFGFTVDPKRPYEMCASLAPDVQGLCFRMRSLMIAQYDDSYTRAWNQCPGPGAVARNECVRGTLMGLFVNNLDEGSFDKAVVFCSDQSVADRGGTGVCFREIGRQLAFEYRPDDFAPDCASFPAEYRAYCDHPSTFPL